MFGVGTGYFLYFKTSAEFAGFANGAIRVANSTTASTNTLHQFVFVLNGTNALLYVDGAQTASASYTSIQAATSSIFLGASNASTDNPFYGILAGAAIFPSALTATQVLNHYNAGK
jgi:hypothetical protein